MHVYLCLCSHTHKCMYLCVNVYTYACMHTSMHTYMHAYMHRLHHICRAILPDFDASDETERHHDELVFVQCHAAPPLLYFLRAGDVCARVRPSVRAYVCLSLYVCVRARSWLCVSYVCMCVHGCTWMYIDFRNLLPTPTQLFIQFSLARLNAYT